MGEAELQDIRNGGNGKVYGSAGDAVRGQYNDILNEVKCEFNIDYSNNIVKGKYINSSGNEVV